MQNNIFLYTKIFKNARVSTKSEEQEKSFDTQIEYYEKHIKENVQYKYMGVYVDKGISGRSIKNRVGFNKMIKDCEYGKIDMIITKSLSRVFWQREKWRHCNYFCLNFFYLSI